MTAALTMAAASPQTSILDLVASVGPLIGLAGVMLTLLFNGVRDERRRRREAHGRALEAVANYVEMPFLIRRRRHDEPSAERARLSEKFGAVQAELACVEAQIRADPDPEVRSAFAALVAAMRTTAGVQAAMAWDAPPITTDSQMSMGRLAEALKPIEAPRKRCEQAMARSTTPMWRRTKARLRRS